jgi:drug/metabolite transporter (DMT)-like permease
VLNGVRRNHLTGLALTSGALFLYSPESLIFRSVEADPWQVLLVRGLLGATGISLVLAIHRRRPLGIGPVAMGRAGWWTAGLAAVSSSTFVIALRLTDAASVLVILATAPMFAALMARAFGVERTPPRTWLATLVVVGALVALFGEKVAEGSLLGVAAALTATVFLASYLTIIRAARAVNLLAALGLGHLLTALIGGVISGWAWLSPPDLGLVAIDGLAILPIATTMLALGPRYLPAPEVALLLPIETAFGSLWTWLALGEVPSARTLVAGSLVVTTVVVHGVFSLRATRHLPEVHSPDLPRDGLG